nr:endolytic transglycosylase MltG [Metabacillus iocasae]
MEGNNQPDDKSVSSVQHAQQYLDSKGYATIKQADYEHLLQAQKNQKHNENSAPHEKDKASHLINKAKIEITSGMTSMDISSKLVEAKIIKNSADFEQYLAKNQLTTKIQIGSYLLSSDMSHKEIAEILTNTN